MGGSHQSATTVVSKDAGLKQYNEQDTSVRIRNDYGHHNIDIGNVGDGGRIFLQNLNGLQTQQQFYGGVQAPVAVILLI